MKPTPSEITKAVRKLSILKFFPAGDAERETLMEILDEMVGESAQLSWLVSVMVNQVGEWLGPKELRGVFCTRFKPLDGIEVWSTIPGFTAMDSESRTARCLEGRKDLQIAGPKEIKLLPLPPEEIAENTALALIVQQTADRMSDRAHPFMRLSEPTEEDREYSRKLLEGIA